MGEAEATTRSHRTHIAVLALLLALLTLVAVPGTAAAVKGSGHGPGRLTIAEARATPLDTVVTIEGTVFHAAQAAGISRQTAYRWQREDPDFAEQWDEAHENAVDVVESTIYQQAIGGNTLARIFYLKAHRPIYRDRLNIDIEQLNSEIKERMAQLGVTPQLRARVIPALTE